MAGAALWGTMCSRYQPGYSILTDSDGEIIQVRIDPPDGYDTEKDARPTNLAPVLLECAGDQIPTMAKWGWQVAWSKSPLINARSETMAEKRTFKEAVLARRCLVPARAWIEFETVVGRRLKRLWRFHRPADEPFAMAGLWEGTPGAEDLRFTIITRAACRGTADIHDRMPVILPPAACHAWLQGELTDPAAAAIQGGWLRRNDDAKTGPNDLLTGL